MRLIPDIRDAIALVGLVAVFVGLALISVPVALVVVGIVLLAIALLPTLVQSLRTGPGPDRPRGG